MQSNYFQKLIFEKRFYFGFVTKMGKSNELLSANQKNVLTFFESNLTSVENNFDNFTWSQPLVQIVFLNNFGSHEKG